MINQEQPETAAAGNLQNRRPRSVTFLAFGVLTIASLNLLRWALVLREWKFLSGWPGISPAYLLLTGLVWSVIGLPVGAGLWRGKPWAVRRLSVLVGVYSLYFWLERLFLYDRPASAPGFQPFLPENWGFLVGSNLFSLVLVWWILSRPKTKVFFGEHT